MYWFPKFHYLMNPTVFRTPNTKFLNLVNSKKFITNREFLKFVSTRLLIVLIIVLIFKIPLLNEPHCIPNPSQQLNHRGRPSLLFLPTSSPLPPSIHNDSNTWETLFTISRRGSLTTDVLHVLFLSLWTKEKKHWTFISLKKFLQLWWTKFSISENFSKMCCALIALWF